MKHAMGLLAAIAALSLTGMAKATSLYSNGFETGDPGTRDIYDSTTNAQGGDITIVPSLGGTLGLTAASGNNYAEITNVDNTYQPAVPPPGGDGIGYGQSIYTDYGAQALGHGVVTNSPFYESTAYYINTGWAAASADNNYTGFWIDQTPGDDGTIVASGPEAGLTVGSLDESQFQDRRHRQQHHRRAICWIRRAAYRGQFSFHYHYPIGLVYI